MSLNEGLVQRKIHGENINKNPEDTLQSNIYKITGDGSFQEEELTLMEKIFLLGLKDNEGRLSFWNDCISAGLRGCILIELALRGRIGLEGINVRRKSLLSRKIVINSNIPTGDALLDETLKHLKENNTLESVPRWIEYLTGETWNLLKFRYQLKNVRNRIAKNLADKGILTTEKQDFLIFDITTHPLIENGMKDKLVKNIQDAFLVKWVNDPHRMDKKMLTLIFLAHGSDVLENIFASLNGSDYELATQRSKELLELNFEQECAKSNIPDIVWAVFAVFVRDFIV